MSSSLIKINKLPSIQKYSGLYYASVRQLWNKDFKPAPYPRTEAEKEAAAKKYGLLPSEYQPYPDDGCGYGDYPKLPDKSIEGRDPYYPWDFPEHKRNFNETLHAQADMLGEDRCNVDAKLRFSVPQMGLAFIGVMGGSALIYYFLDDKRMFRPVIPKQYPAPGVKHYEF